MKSKDVFVTLFITVYIFDSEQLWFTQKTLE